MRQAEYVRAMQLSGSYTPQIVINGNMGMRRFQCLAASRARSRPPVRRRRRAWSPCVRGRRPRARTSSIVSAERAHRCARRATSRWSWWLRSTRTGWWRRSAAGENSGHQVRYDYTVRKSSARIRTESPRPAPRWRTSSASELDPSWKLDHLGVAAFIQDETSLAIDGAAAQYPIAKETERRESGRLPAQDARPLLDGDRLRQVARLIDVGAAIDRDMVREQLQRHRHQDRRQQPMRRPAPR